MRLPFLHCKTFVGDKKENTYPVKRLQALIEGYNTGLVLYGTSPYEREEDVIKRTLDFLEEIIVKLVEKERKYFGNFEVVRKELSLTIIERETGRVYLVYVFEKV